MVVQLGIGVARGEDKGYMSPKIFRKYSNFVL